MKKIFISFTLLLAVSGNTTFAQYCLNFDGTNDYVKVTSYASLQGSSAITVEAWINASAWKSPLYKGSVIATGNNIGQNNGFDLRAGDNGKAEFNVSVAGNWVTATSASIMQTGTWYHLAGVLTGDSVMIYINGVMRALTIVSGSMIPSTGNLYIGESPGWSGRTFQGQIDEVRFWNIARSQSDITSTICSSLTGTEPGLAGYWKFDANNGTTTAVNSVAGGNNGTLTNMSLTAAWVNNNYTCTLSSPDVGVGAVIAPLSNFNLNSAEQVSVSINNYSTNPLTNFLVSYKLGANTPVTETVSASVPPFGSYTYNFTQTADLSAYQNYSLKTYTGLTGDVVAANDTLVKTVSNFATGTNFGVAFDGLDDKIVINDAADLNPTSALTVEVWINASTWRSNTSDGSIIAKDVDAPSRGYVLRCGNNGRVEFQISDNGSWKSAGSPPIMLTNRWYHIAGVFDGTNIKLYVNGELIAIATASAILPSNTPLYIGEDPTWSTRTFNGAIDEVRIWNTGRTQTEIQNNMAVSLAGNEPGLVAYYKMDEGLGISTINDATVNAYTGTLTNFNLATAWVSGYELTNNDAGIIGLIAPNNLTAFAGATRVKVQVKNFGANSISNIPVSYSINNGTTVQDTVTATLAPNEVYTFLFNKVEDLSSLTTASFSAKTILSNDGDIRNDSAVATLTKPAVANTIVAFNAAQHDFGGNGQTHYSEVIFPEAPENFSQVIMHVSVACPTTGCDPWDQAGKISIFKQGQEFELGRFITPYGKACGPWDIDVTDFKTLLVGKQTLQSFVQVWDASGWLLTVSFEFIKGAGTYPFNKITPLWNTDYQVYGDPAIPYTFPDFNIPIDAKTKSTQLRMTITGHGQGNTDNAAEFSQRTHHLWVNGSSQFSHYLWKSDCSQNTCSNQSGTWTLSRAGWCPGQGVIPISNNLTPIVTPGQNADLGYVLESYTNLLNTGYNGSSHTEPYFRIHAYLIESGDTAQSFSDYTNGAATKITSPVFALSLSASETVKAIIRNTGTQPIVNPVLSYFLNGVIKQTEILSITLNPGDSIEHTFSQTADMSVQNDYTIHVLLTVTNDANAADDIATLKIFQVTSVNEINKKIELSVMPNPSNGKFNLKINGVEDKVKISVSDLQGRIIFSEENLPVSSSIERSISLGIQPKGMYFLKVETEKAMRVEKICLE